MPFSLQMKYSQNTFRKGDCVGVNPENFAYFNGDCLSKWLESGLSIDDWRYPFAIIYITDKNMDGTELEVLTLTEEYLPNEDIVEQVKLGNDVGQFIKDNNPEEFNRRYYIDLPEDYNHPVRKQLREQGESSATWSVIAPYIKRRD